MTMEVCAYLRGRILLDNTGWPCLPYYLWLFGALHKKRESHPRKWGWMGSGPFYSHTPEAFGNPTHGSGWIFQIPFYRHTPEASGNPTHGSGWIGSGPFYRHTAGASGNPTHGSGWIFQILL